MFVCFFVVGSTANYIYIYRPELASSKTGLAIPRAVIRPLCLKFYQNGFIQFGASPIAVILSVIFQYQFSWYFRCWRRILWGSVDEFFFVCVTLSPEVISLLRRRNQSFLSLSHEENEDIRRKIMSCQSDGDVVRVDVHICSTSVPYKVGHRIYCIESWKFLRG